MISSICLVCCGRTKEILFTKRVKQNNFINEVEIFYIYQRLQHSIIELKFQIFAAVVFLFVAVVGFVAVHLVRCLPKILDNPFTTKK